MLNFAIRFLQSDTFVEHTDKHIYLSTYSISYILCLLLLQIADCKSKK